MTGSTNSPPDSADAIAAFPRMVIPDIVRQHVEEAASVHTIRRALSGAWHANLGDLARFDELLSAHLEGITIAGEAAWPFCSAGLELPSAGAVFCAAACAIETKRYERLDGLLALADAMPAITPGLLSAFGWLGRQHLQGLVASLLASDNSFRRSVGIVACAMHRVDPGLIARRQLHDGVPGVRARALRTAGQIGCRDALAAMTPAMQHEDADCRFWAMFSAVLLGSQGAALNELTNTALTQGPHRKRAFTLVMQALNVDRGHAVLQEIARTASDVRWLIEGSGIVGNISYVPWLIEQTRAGSNVRLAGVAFALITGADLPSFGLDRPKPGGFESGPNDNPEDDNVEMDADDGLPWPDPGKVERWWAANAQRFQKGVRYFMGAPVTREHCIDVLKNGYQRQRILAAHYLCLMEPGTPLFNTSAPAWRQQRLLAEMR
jgi:uncharacterized protein (TIGR02270 family)